MAKVLFVEPPKDYWFVMGEYLPPPYGLLQLAGYLETKMPGTDIEALDCQAMSLDWKGLEKRLASFDPDVVATSGFATCNVYVAARTLETAKKVNPEILTVAGGQHFSATAEASLEKYPEIDVIVRGEGEETIAELTKAIEENSNISRISGISFRVKNRIFHSKPRPLIDNLDTLPFQGYHFVKDYAHRYHFTMMAGSKARYGMVEASRGCTHHCTFCSQWKHWQGSCRYKSVQRVADEIEFLYNNYGSKLLWLTDDNFGLGQRMENLCDELIKRRFSDDISCFMQARCDDVVQNQHLLTKMNRAGINWLLLGVESNSQRNLESFRKGTKPEDAVTAVRALKQNGIFCQATCIIGDRRDTHESIEGLRQFANELNPDLAIFMILTPFPGTDLYEQANHNGWIENWNWADYDMVHAIMPTESLNREQLQNELYKCYRSFFGSWNRRIEGFFSKSKIKRRAYRYMARQSILTQLKSLV
ncbi:MAG: B12-binding domain-containing radical SAM protein [Candidatus Bathyarchaeota archaeon]|nr:B12-binding domain-containing radical SAM protein [Candidatus Bathyarchaeota archaeon]